MAVVDKALWQIETNLAGQITLRRLADAVDVSEFRLCRAFTTALGLPVMRYVWRRRSSRAAEARVQSRASVLTLALEADYDGLEACPRLSGRIRPFPPCLARQWHLGRVDPDPCNPDRSDHDHRLVRAQNRNLP